MIKKVIEYICSFIGLAGLIIAIGAVGLSDCDLIDFKSLVIRLVVAVILIGVSSVGLCTEVKYE